MRRERKNFYPQRQPKITKLHMQNIPRHPERHDRAVGFYLISAFLVKTIVKEDA